MNAIYQRLLPSPVDNGFQQSGYHIWGSSVIQGDDGHYHMFASRVPDYLRFHPGWMIASEIVRAVSDNPVGPYVFKEVVLPARGAQYWDGRSTHNPKVIKVGAQYALFYMGSSHPFDTLTPATADQLTVDSHYAVVGRSNKRVGVAVSDSVHGPWQRFDAPILQTKPDSYYSFLTSNPSPCVGPDGDVYLMFKSRAYDGDSHGCMHIGMAKATSVNGPYQVIADTPILQGPGLGELEDPYLYLEDGQFCVLAKDQRGDVTGKPGQGILAHSKDGLQWTLDDSPLAYTKTISWESGEVTTYGNIERCSGLMGSEGRLTHLYFAVWEDKQGFGSNRVVSNARNICVPLKPMSC